MLPGCEPPRQNGPEEAFNQLKAELQRASGGASLGPSDSKNSASYPCAILARSKQHLGQSLCSRCDQQHKIQCRMADRQRIHLVTLLRLIPHMFQLNPTGAVSLTRLVRPYSSSPARVRCDPCKFSRSLLFQSKQQAHFCLESSQYRCLIENDLHYRQDLCIIAINSQSR